MLVTAFSNNPLLLERLTVNVDAYMSVAIVKLNGRWTNVSEAAQDLRLDFPVNPKITICGT